MGKNFETAVKFEIKKSYLVEIIDIGILFWEDHGGC